MTRHPFLSGALGLALLLAMAPAESHAVVPPAIGTAFTGWIELAGKQVALPEGSWTLVGRSYSRAPQMTSDAYGAIETVILFRQDQQVVDAFVAASSNVVPIEEGWGTATECLGEDVELPLIVNYDAVGAHTFCGFVAPVRNVVTPNSPGAWRDAANYGKAQGLVPAREWLMAGYRLSDRSEVLDVRYHFNPLLRGAQQSKDDLGRPRIGRLAREHARPRAHGFLQRLGRIGADADALDRGCRGSVTGAAGQARPARGPASIRRARRAAIRGAEGADREGEGARGQRARFQRDP